MKNTQKSVKDRILSKAASLFYIQGVQNTGINQIIDEAQVAKASFYHHFKSKDDLINESLLRYKNYQLKRIKNIIDNSDSMDTFIENWIGLIKKDLQSPSRFNGCPIANIGFGIDSSSEKFQDNFKMIINSFLELMEGFFDRLKSEAKLSVDIDSKKLAKRIFHLYEGALTMWRLTGNTSYLFDLEELFHKVAE